MSSQPKHGKHAKGSQEAKSSQVAQPSQQQASATPGSSAKTQVFQAGKGSSASAQAPSASTHANTKVLNALPAIEADKTLPIDTETPWEEGANGEGKTRWAGDAYPENTQVVGEDAADFSSALNSMPADFSGVKKKKRSKKTVAIVLGVIVAVIVVAYGVGVGVFSNYFFPNTKLGPVDASMKSNAQVEEELSNSIASYTITASGAGFTYTASAKDAGLTVDAQQIVQRAHEELPAWQWPYLLVKSYQQRNDVSDALASTYDSAGLAENIKQAARRGSSERTAGFCKHSSDKETRSSMSARPWSP